MKVITAEALLRLVGELGAGPIDDLDTDLAACGLDSFHTMELIARLDSLGVWLDEDAMTRAVTVRDLYSECLRAVAQGAP